MDPNNPQYTNMWRDTPFEQYIGLRFFFDNLFNFFILILLIQMFLSIIKDYFSRQRESEQKFTDLRQRICLICNLERGEIEKVYSNNKNAIDIHIRHDHNLFDYICYLNYLETKYEKKRDKNIETIVWKNHSSNNYQFLPKNT